MSTINAPRIAINEKTCIAICEPTLCFNAGGDRRQAGASQLPQDVFLVTVNAARAISTPTITYGRMTIDRARAPAQRRCAHRTHRYTETASSGTIKALLDNAAPMSRSVRSWTARRPPQAGHHQPVNAYTGQNPYAPD